MIWKFAGLLKCSVTSNYASFLFLDSLGKKTTVQVPRYIQQVGREAHS